MANECESVQIKYTGDVVNGSLFVPLHLHEHQGYCWQSTTKTLRLGKTKLTNLSLLTQLPSNS